MSEIKRSFEQFFERLGLLIYQHRIKSLCMVFLSVCVLASQIPKIVVDTSSEAMLQKDDPTRLAYNDFRDQFGRDEIIIIAIKAPKIFDADFLKKLKSFHHELEEEVPYVKEVNSLINARNTYGKGEILYVDNLLKDWPEKDIDLNLLKEQVMNNNLFINNIISEDGSITAVIIETEAAIEEMHEKEAIESGFDEELSGSGEKGKAENMSDNRHYLSEKESSEVVAAVSGVMEKHQSDEFSMALSGGPVILDGFNRTLMDDMIIACIICIILIIFFLAILFRRISGVILPIIIIQTSMLSTFGFMAIFNSPMTMMTNAIVPFLLAVSVCDAVHILTIFYMKIDQGYNKEDAIAYSFGHSGLAIVLTSLTTAASLLSFSFAELSAIADMGRYAAAGVMLALIYTIFILPAILSLIPIKHKYSDQTHKPKTIIDRVLQFFTDFSTGHPKTILSVSIILLIVSIIFLFRLYFSHYMVDYFPDTMVVKKDVFFIDRELKGMTSLEIVIDTKKENGICDPYVLNRIEKFSRDIENISNEDIFVGKVFSINDILKETNQALNENDPEHYTIPQNKKAIAQEFLLFENSGSDDMERFVDSQFKKTRISIKTPFVDGVIYKDFMADIEKRLNNFFDDNVDITITGGMALSASAVPKALKSMSKSYVIAFFVIAIMMIMLVGSVKLGLISMFPNLLPIIFIMGLMGFFKIPLDMTTILLGSIAMGLVVDDTVHFMYNFQKYYSITGDTYKAVQETLFGTGRALLITSLIIGGSFLCDLSASLSNFRMFGLLVGLTVISALLADFILSPTLMVLLMGKGKLSKKNGQQIKTEELSN